MVRGTPNHKCMELNLLPQNKPSRAIAQYSTHTRLKIVVVTRIVAVADLLKYIIKKSLEGKTLAVQTLLLQQRHDICKCMSEAFL